jgi:hypothetical protein
MDCSFSPKTMNIKPNKRKNNKINLASKKIIKNTKIINKIKNKIFIRVHQINNLDLINKISRGNQSRDRMVTHSYTLLPMINLITKMLMIL